MNKQDEDKAKEIAKEYGINFPESHSSAYPLCFKTALDMAAWKEDQMIQKAVKWFVKNTHTRNEGAKHFVVSNGEMIQEAFIENLKQAMKGE